MNNYYLMNKDTILLEFKLENILGVMKAVEVKSYSDIKPIGFKDIDTWIDERNYAKHKELFKKWLSTWGIDTIQGFIDITHALGINDCLWVKSVNSELSWEKVNLYENEFSDVSSKTSFETGLYGLKLSSTSPEFTSDGSFPKCWIKEESEIKLLKAGQSGAINVGLEPYSEYMATRISQQISKINKVTSYDLEMFKGKLCSSCSLFTNQDIGFVPFSKFIDSNKKYDIPEVIHFCSKLGFEKEVVEMFFIDSIIFNQDRHLNNFGFLINNNTFEIIGFSPLFDFNLSMLCNALDEDLDNYSKYEDEYQVGHKLGGKFSEVGKSLLETYSFLELPKDLGLPMHTLYNLPINRLKKLDIIFHENINKICGITPIQELGKNEELEKNLDI